MDSKLYAKSVDNFTRLTIAKKTSRKQAEERLFDDKGDDTIAPFSRP